VGVAFARSARLFALNSHFLTPFGVRQLHEATESPKPNKQIAFTRALLTPALSFSIFLSLPQPVLPHFLRLIS